MTGTELTKDEAERPPDYFRQPLPSSYLSRDPARSRTDRFATLAAPLMLIGAFLTGYQSLRIANVNLTLADLAFAAAFGLCAWNGTLTLRPFRRMTIFWIGSLLLILIGLMISTLVHGDMIRWAVISMQYLFGYLLLPMMLLNQPAEHSRRIVLTFILGMVLLEAFGIAIHLTMDHAQASSIFSAEFIAGNGRLSSFAAEPNWNGQLIAMTFPMLIYCYVKRFIPTLAFVIATPILAWSLLLSASFTGFVATMIGVTITLLFLGLRQLAGVVTMAVAAGALYFAVGGSVPEIFEKRVGNAVSEGSLENAGTFDNRFQLAMDAWEMSEDTFIVGLGIEGYRGTNTMGQPVHNLFLLMLVDGGVLSFVGLLALGGTMVMIPLTYGPTSRAGRGTALALVAIFLIYTQSHPHMYSRLNISPVIFAFMLLYVGDRGLTRKA